MTHLVTLQTVLSWHALYIANLTERMHFFCLWVHTVLYAPGPGEPQRFTKQVRLKKTTGYKHLRLSWEIHA